MPDLERNGARSLRSFIVFSHLHFIFIKITKFWVEVGYAAILKPPSGDNHLKAFIQDAET